jgi:hypothetical protein
MAVGKRGESRPGEIAGAIVWGLIVLIILGILLVQVTKPSLGLGFENLPLGVETVLGTLSKAFTPVVSGLFWVVAPQGEGENVQMIAFAIFLLILLVGNKTLQPFIRGPFMALFISAIVGLIAARSLTATILEKSALSASPLAAVSLIIGFIPVYAITKSLDKWKFVTQTWSKMVIFTVIAVVYLFFFWSVFDAFYLGITYAAGIILLGLTELIAPWWSEHRRKAGDLEVGRVMGALHEDEETARAIAQGRAQAIDPRTGRPRYP